MKQTISDRENGEVAALRRNTKALVQATWEAWKKIWRIEQGFETSTCGETRHLHATAKGLARRLMATMEQSSISARLDRALSIAPITYRPSDDLRKLALSYLNQTLPSGVVASYDQVSGQSGVGAGGLIGLAYLVSTDGDFLGAALLAVDVWLARFPENSSQSCSSPRQG